MKLHYSFICFIFTIGFLQAKMSDHFSNPEKLQRYMLFEKKQVLGWCSDEKSSKMLELVTKTKPKICVEIGVYGGSSIFPTALGLKYNKNGIIYAIDPWNNNDCIQFHKEGDPNKKFWGTIDLESVYKKYIHMLEHFQLQKYVKTLRMTSESALGVIPKQIDILHIDGNHQEEACYYDTIHFSPRVKVGGYIWFDDAGWYDTVQEKPTTKKSLDYLLQFCQLIEKVDKGNCYLLKKVKNN